MQQRLQVSKHLFYIYLYIFAAIAQVTRGVKCLLFGCLCRYYVGVLNRATMQMEVHEAQLYNLQPVIPGEATEELKALQDTTVTYRDKVL